LDEDGDLDMGFEGHGKITVLKSELNKLDVLDSVYNEKAGAIVRGLGADKRRRIQASTEAGSAWLVALLWSLNPYNIVESVHR
jgi:hypothetical protein